jgi:hypothetical protein
MIMNRQAIRLARVHHHLAVCSPRRICPSSQVDVFKMYMPKLMCR